MTPAASTSNAWIVTLAHYNRWMNERIYACACTLDDAARKRDVGAFFRSIHLTLNHLLLADRLWLGRFMAAPYRIRGLDQELYADFDELSRERAITDRAIIDFSRRLEPQRLEEPLAFESVVTGERHSMATWHALLHFFNHQTHHRGQITTMLMQQGVDPGITDLVWMPLPAQR